MARQEAAATEAAAASAGVMFLYWGRRGSTDLAWGASQAALAAVPAATSVSIARQNEAFPRFATLGPALHAVDTFERDVGSLCVWRLAALRRDLVQRLVRDETTAVIELMPHIWSARVLPTIRRRGIRYTTVVHDAVAHPGDYRSAIAKSLLDRALTGSDRILTLSTAVADRLIDRHGVAARKITSLFLPDLSSVDLAKATTRPLGLSWRPGAPFKLLWFGRVMAYKGLPLFLDAVEQVRRDGAAIDISVLGEGQLGAAAGRLTAMGATVVNRWLSDDEVKAAFKSHHAVVLSHTEASQSGVAALARGAGMPAIATPVGGLPEQLNGGHGGIIARAVSADALADAIRALLVPGRHETLRQALAVAPTDRSMAHFVDAARAAALS